MKNSPFHLVELLVLVAILGMVTMVLFPAVNESRGGRRETCRNNLKQIGLGLLQYEMRHGHFPGYVNPQAISDVNGAPVATRPVSWVFSILPYLERADVAEMFGTPGLKTAETRHYPFESPDVFLKIFVCPNDAAAERTHPTSPQAAMSYVVNCGHEDLNPTLIRKLNDAPVPRDRAANGIFHFNYPFAWHTQGTPFPAPYPAQRPLDTYDAATNEPVTRVATHDIHDGTATTLLLAENSDSGNWTDALEHQVGFVWIVELTDKNGKGWPPQSLKRPNEERGGIVGVLGTVAEGDYARPSSFHPGGFNTTFADGHTEFVADNIDYEVYWRLMTPCDAEAGTALPAVDAPAAGQ